MSDLIDRQESIGPLRRGYWIRQKNPIYEYIDICSCCGNPGREYAMFKYCPNCGAKMGEENDSSVADAEEISSEEIAVMIAES